MAHPIHEILRRYLGSEQYAFEASAPEFWPSERSDQSARKPDEPGDAEEPTFFDDVYPWLEPET